MITSNLMGGLGNYMFQISAAISLAEKNNDKAVFNFDGAKRIHRNINLYKDNEEKYEGVVLVYSEFS